MRTVHKYEVPINDLVTLTLPCVHELLHFGNQHDVPTLWALVDPESALMMRQFRLAGTGHIIREQNVRHVGTAQFGDVALVFHLFEILEGSAS